MKKHFFESLTCPGCHAHLKVGKASLNCPSCHKSYELAGDVAYLLNNEKMDQRKKRELQVFSDLASYQELMSRPYFCHLKSKISKSLKRYRFKNKAILEIGAGTSEFLPFFEKGNQLVALDLSARLLAQNKTKAHLVVADAENLPFADKSFDFVYLVGVLHHLGDQKKALQEIKRVLKVGGRVFLSEPTKGSLNFLYYLIRRAAIKLFGSDTFTALSGCASPDESFICMKSVQKVFSDDINFNTLKILPLRMPPVKFLEHLFPTRLNDLLESVPLIKNFGTIVFIEGKKWSNSDTRLRNRI